jgi:hypothetical protein
VIESHSGKMQIKPAEALGVEIIMVAVVLHSFIARINALLVRWPLARTFRFVPLRPFHLWLVRQPTASDYADLGPQVGQSDWLRR